MNDLDESYKCPDCRRQGAPMSDEASSDEYLRGWHVTCPECGFSTSGRDKATILRAVAVLASWQDKLDDFVQARP